MANFTRYSLLAAALGVAALQGAQAANCTTDESDEIDTIYSDVSSDDACADLASNTAATSLDYCMDDACMAVLTDAVDQLPDCTSDDDINYKSSLNLIVSYCTEVTEVMDEGASSSGSSAQGSDASSTGDNSAAVGVRGVLGVSALLAPLSLAVYLAAGCM